MAKFYTDEVARLYAKTRRADPVVLKSLADALAIRPNGRYLDIGCGTGTYTSALAAHGGLWRGLDPSSAMLQNAPPKSISSPIDWHCGRAENLPFAKASLDGVISVLATHHFTDISQAFGEMARVLKPHGRLVLFTATRAQAKAFWLADYLPKIIAKDAAALPDLADMQAALEGAGFQNQTTQPFQVSDKTQDRFFYCGDTAPQLYLSADMRATMSVFHHADESELSHGLARLKADIDSGVWKQARSAAPNRLGHYTIITASY